MNGRQGTTSDAVTLYASLVRGELAGEEALRVTHRMLELVMDSIPQAIFWKDRTSTYLGCNKVFADLAGIDPGEMIGKTDLDLPWARFEAPDFRNWDQRVMESGEPKFGILETIHRGDGTTLRIETNKVPLRDLDGQVVGILGTFEDVSDRLRRTEHELRESYEELDERVRIRTAELSRANEILRREVDERVRLQSEERQQRAYAEALRETAGAISRSLDLDHVLEEVLLGVERLMSHDLGAVLLFDNRSTPVLAHYRARFGYTSPDGAGMEVEAMRAVLPGPDDGVPDLGPELSSGEGVRGLCPEAESVIVAPMTVGDQLIGYLVAESATPEFFAEAHVERLKAVADQAAAAISNARLFHRAAELAAVDERQRLARDLHDAVSQSLWTASLLAGSLASSELKDAGTREMVEAIRVLTRGALVEMRGLLLELRPNALEDAGLGELIHQLVEALRSRKQIEVDVELIGPDGPSADGSTIEDSPVGSAEIEAAPIDIPTKLALYRIAQEALNNVARHAEANHTVVNLTLKPRRATLTVRDDGVGFDPSTVGRDGMGLGIMSERAASVGGVIDITSGLGVGTRIDVTIPLEDG